MRLCRFRSAGRVQLGFYDERNVLPLDAVAGAYAASTGDTLSLPASDDLLAFLPPDGAGFSVAQRLSRWAAGEGQSAVSKIGLETRSVELLAPIPRPNKLFLLAGNYAQHIEEGGREKARERQETFPYVFLKPPTTTITDPGKPVRIPAVSPAHIDWELELAVVIGRRCKGVSEKDALGVVAGYTVVNDISDRKFRPNPGRVERPKDTFFDWLHGKWHDSFCPIGPCVASADSIADPQSLKMQLKLNRQVQQDASTALQIFPVAAVIEFISSFVTLEPGDIISTGTPAGVGFPKGLFVKPGDVLEATIEQIGTLVSPVEG